MLDRCITRQRLCLLVTFCCTTAGEINSQRFKLSDDIPKVQLCVIMRWSSLWAVYTFNLRYAALLHICVQMSLDTICWHIGSMLRSPYSHTDWVLLRFQLLTLTSGAILNPGISQCASQYFELEYLIYQDPMSFWKHMVDLSGQVLCALTFSWSPISGLCHVSILIMKLSFMYSFCKNEWDTIRLTNTKGNVAPVKFKLNFYPNHQKKIIHTVRTAAETKWTKLGR